MTTIGIDTGTAMGKGTMVCMLDGNRARFARCSSKHKQLLPRLREIRDLVADAVLIAAPVAMENPLGRQGNARQLLGAYWLLADLLATPDSPVCSVAPLTLKKFATGSGKTDKAQVSSAVVRQWRCCLDADQDLNEDEADALSLALLALCRAGGENPSGRPWTVAQVECAAKAEEL